VPALPDSIVDFVPVDYVADGILELLAAPEASGAYHLVAGEQALTAAELAQLHSALLGRAPVRFVAAGRTGALPQAAGAYLPYFDVRCSFDDARMRTLLTRAGLEKPGPTGYLGQLIAYAHRTRWGKRPVTREASMAPVDASELVVGSSTG
jgi:hypothetical protein